MEPAKVSGDNVSDSKMPEAGSKSSKNEDQVSTGTVMNKVSDSSSETGTVIKKAATVSSTKPDSISDDESHESKDPRLMLDAKTVKDIDEDSINISKYTRDYPDYDYDSQATDLLACNKSDTVDFAIEDAKHPELAKLREQNQRTGLERMEYGKWYAAKLNGEEYKDSDLVKNQQVASDEETNLGTLLNKTP